ncbi:MAG: hypothetical protein AAF677_03735 [Pseudomonadota bacterium]
MPKRGLEKGGDAYFNYRTKDFDFRNGNLSHSIEWSGSLTGYVVQRVQRHWASRTGRRTGRNFGWHAWRHTKPLVYFEAWKMIDGVAYPRGPVADGRKVTKKLPQPERRYDETILAKRGTTENDRNDTFRLSVTSAVDGSVGSLLCRAAVRADVYFIPTRRGRLPDGPAGNWYRRFTKRALHFRAFAGGYTGGALPVALAREVPAVPAEMKPRLVRQDVLVGWKVVPTDRYYGIGTLANGLPTTPKGHQILSPPLSTPADFTFGREERPGWCCGIFGPSYGELKYAAMAAL